MKKLALVGLLFPIFAGAKVTWINATLSNTAVTTQKATLNPSESLTLEHSGQPIKKFSLYCSTSQQEALSDTTNDVTARAKIGGYDWMAFSNGDAMGPTSVTVANAGRISGEGINRQTLTMYCLLHPPGVAASDASVNATGLIIAADLATVPKPVIGVSAPDVKLGTCHGGESLQAEVPVALSFLGYGTSQTSTLNWAIKGDANNPDSSQPTVTVEGSSTSPINIPLSNSSVDYRAKLDYACNTPGNYKWNVVLTYSIQ